METFRVATFYDPADGPPSPGRVRAYLQTYNPQWVGCMLHDVNAANGRLAKQIAIRKRIEIEREQMDIQAREKG